MASITSSNTKTIQFSAFEENKEEILKSEEASGSYNWEVESSDQIAQFLQAKNGLRLKSLPFSIGKLEWILEAFPNGDRQDNIGAFMVYVTLIGLPDKWQSVTFLLRLFNIQTDSSFTGIATYTKKSNSGGWTDGTLQLTDLKTSIKKLKKNKISLGCRIHILQLVGNSNEILYQFPLKSEFINIMKSTHPVFTFKWIINKKLLQKFRKCNIGKKFESDIFYESWSLRCAPNGKREHDKNNVKLYLLLCALPPSIVNCKVKYILSCDECDVKWENIRDFSYKYPNVGWPNGTMLQSELKTKYKNVKQLTFRAHIRILKLYQNDTISDDESCSSSSYDSSDDDAATKNVNIDLNKYKRKPIVKKSASETKKSGNNEGKVAANVAKISAKANLKNTYVPASPNTPGFQMRARAETDVNYGHEFRNNNNNNVINKINNYNRNRNDTVTEKKISAEIVEEAKDEIIEMSPEYDDDEKLNKLENNFATLSSKLNDMSLILKKLNNNNDNLCKMMNEMRRDICLIKYKVIGNDKSLSKKQEKIKNWLINKVELPEYLDIFIENGLDDFKIIKDLKEKELISIGITKLGHKKKILRCIKRL